MSDQQVVICVLWP